MPRELRASNTGLKRPIIIIADYRTSNKIGLDNTSTRAGTLAARTRRTVSLIARIHLNDEIQLPTALLTFGHGHPADQHGPADR